MQNIPVITNSLEAKPLQSLTETSTFNCKTPELSAVEMWKRPKTHADPQRIPKVQSLAKKHEAGVVMLAGLKTYHTPGVVAHTFESQHLRGRGRWISEFEASMVYRVSSRTARAIQRNSVSKIQKRNKTNKQNKHKNKKQKIKI